MAVMRRELKSYFLTPVAYVFIVIFLILSNTFTFYLGSFYERGQADLLPFFTWWPKTGFWTMTIPSGCSLSGRTSPFLPSKPTESSLEKMQTLTEDDMEAFVEALASATSGETGLEAETIAGLTLVEKPVVITVFVAEH